MVSLQSGNQLLYLLFTKTFNRTQLCNDTGTRRIAFCRVTKRLGNLQVAVCPGTTLLFCHANEHTTYIHSQRIKSKQITIYVRTTSNPKKN